MKKKFLENAALVFDVGTATKEYREQIDQLKQENESLEKTLGKTTIERDCPRFFAALSGFALGREVGKLLSNEVVAKQRL